MLGKRKIIALCISKIQDESSYLFINELNRRITEQGDSLFVYHACSAVENNSPNEQGEKSIFEILPYQILDAVIIYDEKIKDFALTKEIAEKSLSFGIQTFLVGRRPVKGCILVDFDYKTGFENVVRHVIGEHKPKTVHFFNGFRNNTYSDERREVLEKILSEYQIPFDESMISYGGFWERPTLVALEEFFQKKTIPEAIICANDDMAITVVKFLKRHGYSVPENVIVSGFDGTLDAELFEPSITTARRAQEDLANTISDIFYQHIAGEEKFQSVYLLEPKLIVGQSCGCPVEHIQVNNQFVYESSLRMHDRLGLERILAGIITKSQIADDIVEVSREWYDQSFRNMFCIIRKDCLFESIGPLQMESEHAFQGNLFELFDNSFDPDVFLPTETTLQRMLGKLENLCNTKQPLIFTALNFLNIPLGFTCHFFYDNSMETYYQIPQIVGALSNAIGGYQNIRYQRYLRQHIEQLYKFDTLTGLYNRTSFMREYEIIKENLSSNNTKVTVVLADLDRLKYINDGFGHEEGDYALKMVADALRYACDEEALCTRYGGDEMLAILTGECEEEKIRTRFHEYLSDCNEMSGKQYEISASIGILQTCNFANETISDLIRQVDILMYRDKIRNKKAI